MRVLDQVRFRLDAVARRPRTTWTEDLVTALFSLWVIGGLFADIWSHSHVPRADTFFSPYHVFLYMGLLLQIAWMLSLIYRNFRQDPSRRWVECIPVGYGVGYVGMVLEGVGGPADFIWHQIFGLEQGLNAVLSPSHLIGVTAFCLVAAAPIMSMWYRIDQSEQRLASFAPVFLPAALIALIIVFFAGGSNLFQSTLATRPHDPRPVVTSFLWTLGVGHMLVTTALLVGIVLSILRRWQVPFGTVTILFAVPAVGTGIIHDLHPAPPIAAGILAGFIGDLLVQWLRPRPSRRLAMRVFAVLLSMVLPGLYLALSALKTQVTFTATVWGGGLLACMLAGFLVSLAFTPPAVPIQAAEFRND
jgi:hypothetical protein